MITRIKPLTVLFIFALNLNSPAQNLTRYVNPFIGTSNAGNTHPGAVLPWGTASVVPHNMYKGPTPYVYGQPYILGFGNLQLSGIGCPETGSIVLRPTHGKLNSDVEAGKSKYRNEVASPGFYSVFLTDHNILAEMTATQRSGRSRFTYPKGKSNLLIDLGNTQSHIKGGWVKIISDTEIAGFKNEGNFCDTWMERKTFFYIKVLKKPSAAGTFNNLKTLAGKEVKGEQIGAYLQFNFADPTTVEVLVGLSFVSIENAKENLLTEQPSGKSFAQIKSEAEQVWNEQLLKAKVEGALADKQKFYTALYHSLIHPMVYNDANTEYLSTQTEDQRVREVKKSSYPRYTIFSLWDTYRSVHPLLTLLFPKQQRDMLESMVDTYKEGKWLPKWELFGQESWVMVGDPASIVIADSYKKGIRNFDIKTAFEAMKKSGTHSETQNYLRPGLNEYLKLGYIPIDKRGGSDSTLFKFNSGYVWGPVSTSQEYYLADYNISVLASALGDQETADVYLKRSKGYKNLFDNQSKFFRPRLSDGRWKQDFDPLDRSFDIRWEKSGGHGFVEGTAWTYRFFAPHDNKGMIQLFGGEKQFKDTLDKFFADGHFDISNEPDITYPYLYNYLAGEENNTTRVVHQIIDQSFLLTPGGIPGNDDAGTLSAWLVFSMMGFYPDSPGTPVYQFCVPKFPYIELDLSAEYWKNEKLIIVTKGDGKRIKEISVDGKKINSYSVSHQDLVAARRIVIETM
jgi:predicted alpha-1,2-mannosidase